MKFFALVALLFLCGCRPSAQELRTEYVTEKNKLGELERKLLEFDRFKVDLAGQERIQKADVDRVAVEAQHAGPEQGDDQKFVETQRQSLSEADRIVKDTRAKLEAEIEEQRKRVANIEARLRQAQK